MSIVLAHTKVLVHSSCLLIEEVHVVSVQCMDSHVAKLLQQHPMTLAPKTKHLQKVDGLQLLFSLSQFTV